MSRSWRTKNGREPALPVDDLLAGVRVAAQRRIVHHGRQRLFRLEDQPVPDEVALQERDVVTCPDTAHTDHLVGDVDHAVVLEQLVDVR
jgi:hypothetical protein